MATPASMLGTIVVFGVLAMAFFWVYNWWMDRKK